LAKNSKKSHQVVLNYKGGWAVRNSDSSRAVRVFKSKDEAVGYAKNAARRDRSEVYIHRKDGTIMEKNSYGRDPNPPKDKKH
jgi:hypothetical protein